MTYHDTVRALIGSLVGGRYFPNNFPQEPGAPTWPAIRGTVASLDNAADQCDAGSDDDDDVRMQIDICAPRYDDAFALRKQVRAAMAAADPPWIRQPGGFETWDAETKVHRMTCDFILFQSTP